MAHVPWFGIVSLDSSCYRLSVCVQTVCVDKPAGAITTIHVVKKQSADYYNKRIAKMGLLCTLSIALQWL